MFLYSRRTFNEVGYNIVLLGGAVDVSLTDAMKNLTFQDSQLKVTDSDQIIEIKICNSLEQLIPTLSIVYEDKSFSLTSYLKQQNLIFKLSIYHDDNTYLNNVWILKDYKIISSSPSSIRYQLFFDNQIAINLLKICHIATSKDVSSKAQQKESPYELAKKLLQSSGLSFYPKNSNLQIKNRQSLPDCNIKISYISDSNVDVLDSMTHLISLASTNGENPPAYFIYNLKDQKCFISTFRDLLKNQNIQQQPPSTQWPFSFIQLFNMGKFHQIKDLKQINQMNKIGRY